MECTPNVIETFDGFGTPAGDVDSTHNLGVRSSLVGAGTMFTNEDREAPVMGNAGVQSCTGTDKDTVFWGFQLGSTTPAYDCSREHIGTHCGPHPPRFRYVLANQRVSGETTIPSDRSRHGLCFLLRYNLIYVRATPAGPSVEMDIGAPTVIERETRFEAPSLEQLGIGTTSTTFEFYARVLRTQNTYAETVIFEAGGGLDGMGLAMDSKHRLILSLCMDGQTRGVCWERGIDYIAL